jgi:hypothetical protein
MLFGINIVGLVQVSEYRFQSIGFSFSSTWVI